MKATYYNILLKTLGLWFVNYTSHKINEFKINTNKDNTVNEQRKASESENKMSPSIEHFAIELDDLSLKDKDIDSPTSPNMLQFKRLEDDEKETEQNPKSQIESKKFFHKHSKLIKTILYYLLNILYMMFILVTIFWKPIYKIIHIRTYKHFMSNAFVFVIPIQYFIELIYFRTSHFCRMLSIDQKYARLVNDYSKFVLITSLIASIVSVLLYWTTDALDIYDVIKETTPNKKLMICVICAFDHFYSCCIFICSVFTFATVFIIHSMSMTTFSSFVNRMKYTSESVNKIYVEYINLKKQYEESVEHLNIMFSTTTIFGLLASYGVVIHIKTGNFVFDIFDICCIILYVVAEFVYFYSIYKVTKSIDLIQMTIISGEFTQKFLKRQPFQSTSMSVFPPFNNNSEKLDDSQQSEMLHQLQNSIERLNMHVSCISLNLRDSLTTDDWVVVEQLISRPWKNFTLFGFTVENAEFVKRISAVIFMYVLSSSAKEIIDLHTL